MFLICYILSGAFGILERSFKQCMADCAMKLTFVNFIAQSAMHCGALKSLIKKNKETLFLYRDLFIFRKALI